MFGICLSVEPPSHPVIPKQAELKPINKNEPALWPVSQLAPQGPPIWTMGPPVRQISDQVRPLVRRLHKIPNVGGK